MTSSRLAPRSSIPPFLLPRSLPGDTVLRVARAHCRGKKRVLTAMPCQPRPDLNRHRRQLRARPGVCKPGAARCQQRVGSPQCTRTASPPGTSPPARPARAPGFPGRGGVGVAGAGSQLRYNYISAFPCARCQPHSPGRGADARCQRRDSPSPAARWPEDGRVPPRSPFPPGPRGPLLGRPRCPPPPAPSRPGVPQSRGAHRPACAHRISLGVLGPPDPHNAPPDRLCGEDTYLGGWLGDAGAAAAAAAGGGRRPGRSAGLAVELATVSGPDRGGRAAPPSEPGAPQLHLSAGGARRRGGAPGPARPPPPTACSSPSAPMGVPLSLESSPTAPSPGSRVHRRANSDPGVPGCPRGGLGRAHPERTSCSGVRSKIRVGLGSKKDGMTARWSSRRRSQTPVCGHVCLCLRVSGAASPRSKNLENPWLVCLL